MDKKYNLYILNDSEEGLELDKTGNYIDYHGIKDNIITEEDDLMISQEKIYAQERWLVENGYTSMDMLDYKDKQNQFELPGLDH